MINSSLRQVNGKSNIDVKNEHLKEVMIAIW